jgi:RNA 3'-phosphate cyclase
MIEIDGGYGEGGGQIVRVWGALDLLTQTPVRIKNIRAGRERSGLRPQHLAGLKLLTELSSTKITGLKIGSREVEIVPGKLQGGRKKVDIGTAGSISLLLQSVILPFLTSDQSLELTIIGGTDVTRAPTMDYLSYVLIPILRRLGANVEIACERRGFYPAGGGIVHVKIEPSKLNSFVCVEREGSPDIRGRIVFCALEDHVPSRIKHAAIKELIDKNAHISVERVNALSPGVSITLWAEYANTVLGASNVGARGIPAEVVGGECADDLVRSMGGGATIDAKMCDQILPYLVFANGTSRFLTKYMSLHGETVVWVLQHFVQRKIEIMKNQENVAVSVV